MLVLEFNEVITLGGKQLRPEGLDVTEIAMRDTHRLGELRGVELLGHCESR
jgi:hypothetical protein